VHIFTLSLTLSLVTLCVEKKIEEIFGFFFEYNVSYSVPYYMNLMLCKINLQSLQIFFEIFLKKKESIQ